MNSKGFTLLEVLVALTVVALALVTLMQTFGQGIAFQSGLSNRVWATWVAQNRWVEMAYFPQESLELKKKMVLMGFNWEVELDLHGTPIPGMQRAEIKVRQEGKDNIDAQLTAVIGQLETNLNQEP